MEDSWSSSSYSTAGNAAYASTTGVIYVFFDHLPNGISPYLKDQWKNIFEIMDVPPNYEVY